MSKRTWYIFNKEMSLDLRLVRFVKIISRTLTIQCDDGDRITIEFKKAEFAKEAKDKLDLALCDLWNG